jgi:UDP-glucose 4-epimerase
MSDWIFVTGGCGYIGSHISAHLKTVTDKSVMIVERRGLELPHVPRYCDIFADEDFSSDLMMQAIRDCKPSTVIHCADDPSIENGIQHPLDVWDQNVTKTVKLLRCCAMHGVKNFIFYSSIVGTPILSPFDFLGN